MLRWNARINLTSVRDPEQIVTRHFGESLFAARALFLPERVPHPSRFSQGGDLNDQRPTANDRVIDIGSGAGFPGLPIKIWAPEIHLTLIESNQKKATFLREVARAIKLTDVDVFAGRAQDFSLPPANSSLTVTLRAVEHFERTLPLAAGLARAPGRLAMLIGESQVRQAHQRIPSFVWSHPVKVPLSSTRVLLIGLNQQRHVQHM
jgi:16S rRNA (guanine527-N7)-methyltransferase